MRSNTLLYIVRLGPLLRRDEKMLLFWIGCCYNSFKTMQRKPVSASSHTRTLEVWTRTVDDLDTVLPWTLIGYCSRGPTPLSSHHQTRSGLPFLNHISLLHFFFWHPAHLLPLAVRLDQDRPTFISVQRLVFLSLHTLRGYLRPCTTHQ